MNTFNDNIYKKVYSQPQIECVKLDNEIALTLESDPAGGPGEGYLPPENFRQEPFKTQLG